MVDTFSSRFSNRTRSGLHGVVMQIPSRSLLRSTILRLSLLFHGIAQPIARPIARIEDRLRNYWAQTPPRRRFARVTGIVLFACMTLVTMADNGCGACPSIDLQKNPGPAILMNYMLGLAGVHYHTTLRPQFTGTDNSQTGAAAFLGNLTSIAQPTSTYFAMLRMSDCSLALVTATSPLDGTFTVNTTANTNYEQTLHQLAGLKTTPDVFPNGCKEGTTDLSARVAVNAGVTKSNIAVLATAESNGANNSVFILTSNADQSSVTFKPIPGTNSATALVTADLDGDGSGDLVAVNAYNATSSYVTVMLGNADGSFKTPINYTTAGNYSVTATLDDIDGDGKLDIVSVSADQQISILTGKGDGSFNAAQSFAAPALPGSSLPASSTPITNIITADVNGDGKRDLICSNGLVLLGDGHGNFTAVTSAAFPYTQGFTSAGPFIAAGDLDNDGIVDLAMNDGSSISTWKGKGDGTFTRGSKYATINNTGYITLSDLDGDGNLDIYTGLAEGGLYSGDNSSFASSYVLMGFGNGNFQGAPNLFSGAYNGTNLADVTGDGIPDLVTYGLDPRSSVIGFNLQVGTTALGGFATSNTFSQPASFTVPGFGGNYMVTSAPNTTPSSYAVADVNGDSRADVVFVDNNLPATSPTGSAITLPFPVYFVALYGGLNSFGLPSAVSFPQIAPASGFDNTLTATNIQIADFNHDGKADLIFTYDETAGGPGAVPYNRGFAVLTGNGNGTFSNTPILTSTYSSSTAPNTALLPKVVSTTDLNGDNIPDLIVLNPTFSIATGASTQLLTYIGNGDGTFQPPSTFGISANVYGIPVLADFDNDGKLDLAFLAETSSSQAQLAIAKGNGNGTFGVATLLNLTGGDSIRSASIAAADFDGDSKIDLALLEPNAFSGIFYGKGDGTFTSVPGTNFVVPKDLINISAQGPAAIVSLNGSGRPDLLVGSTVLLNNYAALIPTTTALTASGASVPVGATLNLIVHITPGAAGVVLFKDGNTTLGSAVATSGLATLPISTLASGVHNITAYYVGNTVDAGSISSAVAVSVGGGSTTTTTALTASDTNPTVGTSITITATITPGGSGSPTGTVTFTDGLITLGTGTVSSNKATYTTSTLATGTHNITAVYQGDSTFAGSIASALAVTVKPIATTTAVTASANPVTVGASITFTATITPAGSGTATGSVTFMDGATTLGTGTVSSSNIATYTTSTLTTGTHNITAIYSGDSSFATSTSSALAITINPVPTIATTTSLSASANTAVSGTSLTFTATVTPASGTAPATGSVVFKDGATTLTTATLDGTGKATYTTSSLAVGSHTIVAAYGGVTTFSASTSNSLPITITAPIGPDFTPTLSSSTATVVHGSPATATITVTSSGGFAAATSLTCMGAPTNSLCIISPSSVTPTATTPATATLTLQTSVQSASLSTPRTSLLATISLAATLPLGLLSLFADRRRNRRSPLILLLAFAVTTTLLFATGCGGGSSNSNTTPQTLTTAPGTYPLTVTATSGALTHTTTFTVTVQ